MSSAYMVFAEQTYSRQADDPSVSDLPLASGIFFDEQ